MGPTDPVERRLLSRTATIDGRRPAEHRRCRSGGIGRRARHPRCSSTTRSISASSAGKRWRRGATGSSYATKQFSASPWPDSPYEEGCNLDVSTGGELHVALTAGVPADRLVFHGNTSPKPNSPAPWRSASAASWWTRSTRSTGSRRWWPSGRSGWGRTNRIHSRPRCSSRITPGVEVYTHRYVQTGQDDSKFGFGLASGAAGRAVERLTSLHDVGVVEFAGIHAHLGSQVFALDPFVRAVEVLAAFFATLDLPELVVGGGLGVAYVNGEEAPPMAQWAARVRSACLNAGIPASVRISAEPGRAIVASAGTNPLHGRHGEGCPGLPNLCIGRRWDERQSPPGAVRQRLRGISAPGGGGGAAHGDPAGGQTLRDRRRGRLRRLRSRRPQSRRQSWPPRSPVPTAIRWRRTTTRSRGRRWSSCPGEWPARSSAVSRSMT